MAFFSLFSPNSSVCYSEAPYRPTGQRRGGNPTGTRHLVSKEEKGLRQGQQEGQEDDEKGLQVTVDVLVDHHFGIFEHLRFGD